MLDPHPKNQLGKGILDPAEETELLAEGLTYAERVTYQVGRKTVSMLLCARRPMADWTNDMLFGVEKSRRASERTKQLAAG